MMSCRKYKAGKSIFSLWLTLLVLLALGFVCFLQNLWTRFREQSGLLSVNHYEFSNRILRFLVYLLGSLPSMQSCGLTNNSSK